MSLGFLCGGRLVVVGGWSFWMFGGFGFGLGYGLGWVFWLLDVGFLGFWAWGWIDVIRGNWRIVSELE